MIRWLFWIFIQMNWNQFFKIYFYSHCPLQHYSHKPRSKDLNVYSYMNEWRKCGIYIQWNITWSYKQGNSVICYKNMENLTKWNKPVTEGQILRDSTFVSSQSRQTHRIRKYNGGCWGLVAGIGGRCCLMGFSRARWQNSKDFLYNTRHLKLHCTVFLKKC